MTYHLQAHFHTGMVPSEFINSMTRNQEAFQNWYAAFSWPSEDAQAFFEKWSGPQNLRCLIIAADWCGDVVRNVPVVLRLTKAAGIATEILVMEQNLNVTDQFLTFGGRSIPVVLFAAASGEVLAQWGPRPTYVQEPMAQFKALKIERNAPDYDELMQGVRAEVRRRYGEGSGYQQDIVREIRALLEPLSNADNVLQRTGDR